MIEIVFYISPRMANVICLEVAACVENLSYKSFTVRLAIEGKKMEQFFHRK